MRKVLLSLLALLLMLTTVVTLASCKKVEFKVDFVVDGQVYSSLNTNGQEVIKMPNDPEKEGYIFDGWYWDKDSWKRPFTANSLLDAPLSDNMSVYAKWSTIESVSGTQADFISFEKTGAYEYSLTVSNSTSTISLEPLVSINSSSSWSLSTDIYGNQTIASRTATLIVGDNTYYALVTAENGSTQLYTLKIRRKPMYNVIFDTMGGTSVESQQVEEDAFAVAPETTREGYDFSAWNYDFTAPITENKIIVASWTAKQFTVTYNADGGNVENNTTTVTYDSEYILEVPARRGYEFLGWYHGDEKIEGEAWQIASDVTLLAKWNLCEYAITYNLNGGSVEPDNPVVYTIESDNVILTAPSRVGYIFLGWTGTDIIEPSMSVIIYTGSIGDKEYVANWDYEGYDITYHLDGGENHANNPDGYIIDSANIYLENPSRVGYIFGGWYTSNSFSADSKVTVIATGSTGDKDLYAKWTPITYTINFNKNASSATGAMDSQVFEYNETQSLTANLFERTGYTFIGWTTNADGTGTAYNNGSEIFNLTTTYGDVITLYAKWEANTYTITLDKNGSNGGSDSVTALFDSAMPAATAPNAYEGYIFVGYYDAQGVQYYDSAMTSVKVWDKAENTTLYARWVPKTITITLDKQNGSYGTNEVNVTFASAMPTATAPTRTGYTFAGYFSEPNGQGTQYYNENMESVHNWDLPEATALYAAWDVNTYDVSFDANGGSLQQDDIVATFDAEMPGIATIPTRTGYMFLGYFDAANGGTKYYNADLTSAKIWDKTNSAVLYAQWAAITYNVVFDANTGDGTMISQQIVYDTLTVLNANDFSKTGYAFVNWNTEADGSGTSFNNNESVINLLSVDNGSITLYAQWVPVDYTIIYQLNGGTNNPSNIFGFTIEDAAIELLDPSKVGYTFGGWYTDSEFTNSITTIEAGTYGDVTVYAKWDVITYNVFYELNGGSNFAGNVDSFTIESDDKVLLAPTKVGYTFGGWYTDSEFTNSITMIEAGTHEDVTVYARWIVVIYHVDYVLNGGASNDAFEYSFTIESNDIELPEPTKTGYTFGGWYTDPAFTNAINVIEAGTHENVIVYAKWDVITYNVSYELNGGTNAENVGSYTIESEDITLLAPTKTGYTFGGWYTDSEFTNSITTIETGTYGDVTVYAKWNVNIYDVFYILNGGASNDAFEYSFTIESNDIELPEPTKTGYTFGGWYTDPAFTNAINVIEAGTHENVIVYAKWDVIIYNVSYELNGGTNAENVDSFTIESEDITLLAPTKTGYTFGGWYTDSAFINPITVIEAGTYEDVTVYAQWTVKTVTGTLADLSTPHVSYTVSFNLNGASGTAPAAQIVTETIGLTYPTIPTRSGYIFAGWYTNSSCSGNPYDFTEDVIEDIILYAKWIYPSSYTKILMVGSNTGSTSFNSTIKYYPFVSLVDQTITIYTSHSSGDPKIYLYDSSKSQLAYNDDYSSYDSQITYTVTAGTLYYAGFGCYSSSSGTGYMYITGTSYPTAGGVAGGIVQVTEQLTYDQNFTLDVPTKEGYNFLGWYDGVDGTGIQYTDATGASIRLWDKEENTTLYAKWEAIESTVTFDKQNGTDGSDSVTAIYDSAMPSATAPTRVGYTFMGYYDAISGGTKYYNADMTSAKVWDLTENTTLYARWSANTYTITFDKQGGSGTSSATATYDSTLPTVSKPTKIGHTFLGYYDAIVGGTQYYDANMSSSMLWSATEDVTLYAHWEANTYTVTFNTNQGSGAQSAVTATYGAEMPEITVAPTRVGYIFLGYYDALTGGTKYYNADLTSANTWVNTSNITLYACWQGISYHVSFDANNGIGTMATQEFEYGVSEYLNSNVFTRTGYTFAGWNTAADGSGTSYANTASVLNLTSESGATITLYAQWTAKTVTGTLADLSVPATSFTVSFNLNGASGTAPAAQTVTETVGLTYPAIPTRSGYVFAGWYTTSSCTGNPYDFTADVTSNVTLYAKWRSYSSSAIAISYGNNMINIVGGNDHYFAFVALTTGTITIDVGKNAWIGVSTSANDSGTHDYQTISYSVTRGNLYYIHLESYRNYSTSEYVGSTYLNITGTITPPSGGLAGGIVLVTEQLTYNQNFTLDVPTKVGYNFLGWYDGVGGTGTQYTDAAGASVRLWDKEVDTTLYAKWEAIESTVIFENQNGTDGSDSVTATYDSAMPFATAPTRVGYTFMGYYTAISGGTKYYNADMTSARVWDLTEDTILYARWSANTYTITFDKQGGSGTSSATATYDSTLPTVSKPTKIGHTFLGYYDAIDGGTQYYDANMSSTMLWSATEDVTLYAHWEANTYTVTFNTNQGSGAQSAVTATYGAEMPEITVAPTRVGYIFLGYYDALTGGTKYYNADLTSANTWVNPSNITLYARWQGISYHVSFDANNGIGTMATQEFEYGVSEYLNSNVFTRTGYTFAGWNTAADGSGTSYNNNVSVLNLTSESGETITLYAQWTAKTVTGTLADISTPHASYTVSFNLNGASGSIVSQTVTETVGLTYPTIPTRSGYAFAGWYANSNCTGTPYDFSADVAEDITLYAKWVSMTSSYYSREYVDIANYNSSSNKKSVTASSYSAYNYYYFTCYKSGTYTIYANWIEGDYKFNVSNVTSGSTIISDFNLYDNSSQKSTSQSFTASAGDVICVRTTRYSSSYNMTSNGTFYVTGASYPTAGGKADGVVLVTEQLTYDQNFTLDVPTKEGYNFLGWYDGIGGTGTQYTDATGASVRLWDKEVNTTLYAKWEAIERTVTFDKQNGMGGSDSVTATYDSTMPSAIVPTRVGYTFMGYYTAISGGTKYYNADMTSARVWDLTEDTILYARWSANTYTITFDKQGGSGTSSATVTYDANLPTVSKPTKIGHTFLGYYDAIVGGTQYYDANMSSTMLWSDTEDVTLYAHWEVIEYTVTFNTNQGSGAQTAVIVTYGAEMPVITVAPTRVGYIFLGYYDALTGGTKYYNEDLTSANTWANTSNKTLYARWQGVPYYVSFNANNGTGTMATQEFEYGVSEYLNSNAFTRVGYTFAGWNTAADGSGTSYANTASVLNLTSVSGETITLYAQWTAKTVTGTLADATEIKAEVNVTFDRNYSGSSTSTVTVTNGQTLTYPTNPTRSGYVFTGWYTDSSCTTRYNFSGTITDDMTLYAGWRAMTTSNVSYKTQINPASYTSSSNYYSIDLEYSTSSSLEQIYLVAEESGIHYIYHRYYCSGSIDSMHRNYVSITNLTTGTTILSNSLSQSSFYCESFSCNAGDVIVISMYKCDTGCYGDEQFYFNGFTNPTSTAFANGEVLATEQLTYDQNFTLDVPTKEGYNFLGWYDGVDGTGTQYTDATGASVRLWDKEVDATLYAKWEAIESTVTFDKQNGTDGSDSVTAIYDSAMPSATAPTRVGYTFMGYYDAISGGTKYYNADMTSAKVWDLTENITLYARWSANTYTITFDNQGAVSGTASTTAVYASTLPIVSKPTKTGYTFLGYYDAVVGGTQYYDANMSGTMTWTRTEGITLYAHWQVNTYTVSFNTNQGSGAQSAVTATYGAEMPEITVAPTRVGYIFLGYYDALTGGTKYYNADLTSANTWANTSNKTLYARWQGIPYYVSFNANNGMGTMAAQEFEYGVSEYLNSNVFTRTGYTFAGWNTAADGSGTSYANTASVLNLTSVSGETITLYAQWTAKTVTGTLADLSTPHASYTVTFNLNGASGTAPAAQTVTETIGLTYPSVPTRSGYAFAGWYTTSSCSGNPYDFTVDVTEDITLYAKWISMNSSYSSREYVDIANYNSSSNKKSVTITATSSSSKNYYYFTCYKAGTYTLYTYYSSGDFYISAYNATTGTTILSNTNFWSNGTTYKSASFTANAGDVIYISLYKYSSSGSTGYGTFYVSNASYPTAGGVADGIVQVTEQLTYDQNFTLDVPTKEGYTFLGWYDGVDGTGTQYTDATGASVRLWDKEVDATLYAKWNAIEYSITYDLNGGENSDNNPSAYNIETDTIILSSPIKPGYTFIGWTSDTVTIPTKNLVINTGSIGDITLTANWIEYDVNDITYNTGVKDFSIFDELTAEYFGAQCIDTDGNAVTVTASFVTAPVAGETTSVLLVATSGGKTTETIIENVMIYGTPTINVGNTAIKSTASIIASTFEATAMDSFGNTLSVSVSLVEGDVTCGGYRTYEFVAVDCVGNEAIICVAIMVYSADDIKFAVNDVAGINIGSAGAEFGAVANDSFGNSCVVEFAVVSGDINMAGSTVNVRFTATDVAGNVSTMIINNVKVYGTPVATMNVLVITDSTSASDLYTVRDSFGVVLDATVTFVTAPIAGQNVAISIVAVDAIGNQLNTEYILPVICTFHAIGANCTCEVCGTAEHTQGESCVCLVCGSGSHDLDANCVCRECGVTTHNLNANCVCLACGNEYHNDNGAGVCLGCGAILHTADVWDGTIASSFARGSGTSSSPYIIETGAQLAYLASRVNAGTSYSGCYFRLDNDIDLNSINWTPIGRGDESYYFAGRFDGNGHTITSLNITGSKEYVGLFGSAVNATISNLALTEVNVNAYYDADPIHAAALCGYSASTTITNCSVSGTVYAKSSKTGSGLAVFVGMIVGECGRTTTISSCHATGTVTGEMTRAWNVYAGGIVGAGYGTIIGCFFNGQVIAKGYEGSYAGGIAGITNGSGCLTIEKCVVVGTITATYGTRSAQAIVSSWNGYNSTVRQCYYNATTTSSNTTGTSTTSSNLRSESWLTSTLGWDFDSVWAFVEGNDYPVLKAFN